MAWIGSLLLLLLSLGLSWFTGGIYGTGLPFSDKAGFTVMSVLSWAAFVWCLDRAINPRPRPKKADWLVGSLRPDKRESNEPEKQTRTPPDST